MEKETQHNTLGSSSPFKMRPITNGLGLNNFEEGLPYSSSRKNSTRQYQPKQMVQFNFPNPRSPLTSASSPQVQPQMQTAVDMPTEHPAGMFRRILAFVFDSALAMSIFFVTAWSAFHLSGYELNSILTSSDGMQMLWPLILFYIVIHISYFLIQETTWKKTIGKKLFGIELKSPSSFAVLARAFCFYLAIIPFGIGLFWHFFNAKGRCWHDMITDSDIFISE